jgi:hypothetical protein
MGTCGNIKSISKEVTFDPMCWCYLSNYMILDINVLGYSMKFRVLNQLDPTLIINPQKSRSNVYKTQSFHEPSSPNDLFCVQTCCHIFLFELWMLPRMLAFCYSTRLVVHSIKLRNMFMINYVIQISYITSIMQFFHCQFFLLSMEYITNCQVWCSF